MQASKGWRVLFALGLLAALGAGPRPAGAGDEGERVAATVNGVAISLESVERLEAIMPGPEGPEPGALSEEERSRSRSLALQRLINEELLYQEAVARGIDVDKEEVHQVIRKVKDSMPTSEFSQLVVAHLAVKDEIYKTIERDLMIQRLFQEEVLERSEVSEEEVESFYRQQQEYFRKGPEVRLQQIIVPPEPVKAREIAARARAGEDFSSLARTYSVGPGREKGGDFGWRTVEHLPAALREALEEAREGQTVGPLPNPSGFLIAKVLQKRPSRTLSLEEARGHVTQQLREKKIKQLSGDLLEGLRSRAEIEVFLP